jgi:hypothetical protein
MGMSTRTGRAGWGTTSAATAIALLIIAGCSSGGGDERSSADLIEADDPAEATSGRASVDRGAVDASSGDPVEPVEMPVEMDDAAAIEESGATMAAQEASAPTGSAAGTPLTLDELGRSIAVEAGITLGTADVRATLDRTLEIIRSNNGIVDAADVRIGTEYEDGSVDGGGRITAKVPPADLDRLIDALDGEAGTMLARTQLSDDVTEQLIDIDTRIAVERTTIEQFEQLLAAATEFGDVVEIQRVISEHTTTLERLLASQRSLEQRVELSTLTIDIQYVAPVDESSVPEDEPADDDPGLGDRFGSGWDAFAGAVFAVAMLLAVAAPFIAVASVLALIGWVAVRVRRRGATAPAAAPARPDDPGADATGERDPLVGASRQE